MLRAVAEEKTARISRDRKDAATAYRNLGAIAGLGDPKQALDAYNKAIELDPDDAESLLGAGWIEKDRGHLDEAERRFRRVLELAKDDADRRYWARLALGDVKLQRGDLAAALSDYKDAMAEVDGLAKSDPGNAGWQRDLSVSYDRVGDVLVAQGNLPEALKSYRDGLAIRDRLAKSDPGNAQWQRDLSVSYAKLAVVFQKTGAPADALSSLRQGQEIIARMTQVSPDNATWRNDLAWFNDQIAQMKPLHKSRNSHPN
jgi:tetratricopeptide (TPR) repeat protein